MKILFALVTSLLVLSPALAKAEAPQALLGEAHRAFFKSYCVECHNADKQKGKLRLDDISFDLNSIEKADRWQKILNTLKAGEMPPEDAKQPDKSAKTEFLDKLIQTPRHGDSTGVVKELV